MNPVSGAAATLLCTSALSLSLAAPAWAASAEDPLKVGLISTLSGGGAGLGVDVRDGFLLAIDKAGRDDITVIVEIGRAHV